MDKWKTPNLLEAMKKKKVRCFTKAADSPLSLSNETNKELDKLGLDADSVISITASHDGFYYKCIVWYRI